MIPAPLDAIERRAAEVIQRSKPPRKPEASEREIALHTARVCLREARLRRAAQPRFADVLLLWAANARRRAVKATETAKPAQRDLFGGR